MENLDQMLEKLTEVLRREVNHLFGEVSKGPLHKDRANALVQYIKVLTAVIEERQEVEDSLKGKSEEELREIAQNILSRKA